MADFVQSRPRRGRFHSDIGLQKTRSSGLLQRDQHRFQLSMGSNFGTIVVQDRNDNVMSARQLTRENGENRCK